MIARSSFRTGGRAGGSRTAPTVALTALLVLFAPVVSAQVRLPDARTEAARLGAFHERRDSLIAFFADQVPATDLARGGAFNVAADLYRGQDVGWAVARIDTMLKSIRGDMFWMYPFVTMMYAGRDVLPEATRAKMRDAWRTYMPYRGDTENHWVMYYASLYLAGQMYPDDGPETWYTGKSSAENMAESREFLEHWMDLTTSRGQGEYDSPGYMSFYVAPMAMLAAFAEDPAMQQRGRMMLDYLLADFYAETLDGVHVGASSRLYPNPLLNRSLENGTGHAWLLFGNAPFVPRGEAFIVAISGYEPGPILHGIATDRSRPYLERELKRTRHRIREARERNAPVYKTTYVAPEYAVGSTNGGALSGGTLQPIQEHSWEVQWRLPDVRAGQNMVFAVHPYEAGRDGAMYFAEPYELVTELIVRSKTEYDKPNKWTGGSPYEHVAQVDDAIVALYNIPAGTNFPHVSGFFPRTLTVREDDPSGWIFARGGDALIAYRPLAPYEWRTDPDGHHRLHSPHLKNGAILQVAPASAYPTFDAFKAAVRALPVQAEMTGTPRVRFTTLRGKQMDVTYGEEPRVDGQPIGYASWPLYESPFLSAARDSRRLEMRYGPLRRTLDFSTLTITDSVEE
jgi:hypothetical protein